MVEVPAGWFTMGVDNGEYNEGPAFSVYVNAFKIDRTEVSASQFAEFLNANGNPVNAYFTSDQYSTIIETAMVNATGNDKQVHFMARPGYENYPANNVSWYGAADYCRWKGKRLPTEAQWEKAARGTDGRVYPWGNTPPSPARARYDRSWNKEGLKVMAPVDAMSAGTSPYGALNMAGNVWEWVEDYYFQNYCNFCRNTDWDYLSEEVFGYQDPSSSSQALPPKENPTGPSMGHFRVLRGGSWFDTDGSQVIRTTYRYWLRESERYVHTGFRCASGTPRKRPAFVPPPEPKPAPKPVAPAPPTPIAAKVAPPAVPMLTNIGNVYFDYDMAIIKKKYISLLYDKAQWLKDHTGQSLLLVGHCDDQGSDEYNYLLGIRRALAVRAYLLGLGADPARLGISSEGNSSPFCLQHDQSCRASNRRTSIVAYNPSAGIPAGFLTVAGKGKTTEVVQAVSTVDKKDKASDVTSGRKKTEKISTISVAAPDDIAQFRGLVDVNFKWEPVSQAASYRYILSHDPDFRRVIYTSPQIPDPSYEATFLDYGTYYFKVEALGKDGHITGASPVQSFIITPGQTSH